MESIRILVTGHLGYIGSHVVTILKNRNILVGGVDLGLFVPAIVTPLTPVDFEFRIDFRELDTIDLRNFDAIIHLAAISNDPMGAISPGLTFEINGKGTVELAKRAKAAGVKRFVFASSCSVYGGGASHKRTERDPVQPLSEYAESKLFAENGLSLLNDEAFSVYLLRNATAYGASKVFRSDLVINNLALSLMEGKPATLNSDGTQWRPFIHCLDIAKISVEFALNDLSEWSGIPINTGFQDHNIQILELKQFLLNAWPDGLWQFSSAPTVDPRDYKVDFSLFQNVLPSIRPSFGLEEGVLDLRDFFSQFSVASREIGEESYVRLTQLKRFKKPFALG